MNPRQRIVRFQRLLRLDQQRLDRLAEETRRAASAERHAHLRWTDAQSIFAEELQRASAGQALDAAQVLLWSTRQQQALQVLEQEWQQARLALQRARDEVQSQQTKVKGWEKLLVALNARQLALDQTRESNWADEQHLQKQYRQQQMPGTRQ